MSDHESHHEDSHHDEGLSPTPSHTSTRIESLYDHRHQADSLPIRRGSVFDLPPPAVAAASSTRHQDPPTVTINQIPKVHLQEGSDNEDDYAIHDSPVMHAQKIHTNTNVRPSRLSSSLGVENKNEVLKKIRSRSFSDKRDNNSSTQGILLNKHTRSSKGSEAASPVIFPLSKTMSRQSRGVDVEHELTDFERRRRYTRTSIADSDADSHGSRESQETEEDVCFPMLPEHVKVNGIDFHEIEEYIQECHDEDAAIAKARHDSSSGSSTAALKYTPATRINTSSSEDEKNPGVSFGSNKVEGEVLPPDRFSFFCSESEETIHAPDIPSLVKPNQSVSDLFRNGESTWWLDCVCPTDAEMKVLAKAFGIHPLTAEDIRMQETREKVELFRSYYFVCFHTFESDNESEDFLEPINVYIVVFRSGVLTFHFGPISHAANVRRRVRQLRDYVDVSADWLCYALIDDITDSFAPVIHAIEYEADAIEDSVFLTRDTDLSHMLQKIGESRRKVMTLMRLLSGKADVIKMFSKRCQDEAQGIGPALTSSINLANLSQAAGASGIMGGITGQHQHQPVQAAQPRGDIALYLGDIQDHVVTMYQNLLSYEKIFSRSHSNYLAQLQVESFYSNNKVTEMLSKVTLIGTILVPMNLITGLFGMNVTVPGQSISHLGPFFGILGFVLTLAILSLIAANWWLNKNTREGEEELHPTSGGRSILNWGRRPRNQQPMTQRENRSIISYPSRINRYD